MLQQQLQTNFLTMISMNLFHCCEKMFTHINTWAIRKKSMKHRYINMKIFSGT